MKLDLVYAALVVALSNAVPLLTAEDDPFCSWTPAGPGDCMTA